MEAFLFPLFPPPLSPQTNLKARKCRPRALLIGGPAAPPAGDRLRMPSAPGTSLPLASVWAAETLASGGPGPCGERAVGARRAKGRRLRAAVRRGQRASS